MTFATAACLRLTGDVRCTRAPEELGPLHEMGKNNNGFNGFSQSIQIDLRKVDEKWLKIARQQPSYHIGLLHQH